MGTWGWDEHKQHFLELVQEVDCIEALRWCRAELDRRIAEVCTERARDIHDGDTVEVTEGPLSGICGTVLAHCCRTADSLLVELEGLRLDLPLPIPASALRVLVTAAAHA